MPSVAARANGQDTGPRIRGVPTAGDGLFAKPAKKFFESMLELLYQNTKLSMQAKHNSRADFRGPFFTAFTDALFDACPENEERFRKLSDNTDNAHEDGPHPQNAA